MPEPVPYDDFADIYDAWCESAPITRRNHGFYVRRLVESPGPVAELGVGNGRICVEVAKRGKTITGVDSSTAILNLCRTRSEEAGVADRLRLVQADFREFELSEPAELIVLPFHSIGHLLTAEDKLRALRTVRRQLVPGGTFVFDHFIFDPSFVTPGVPHLRAEFRNPVTGRESILWEASTRDSERQLIHILVWTDELDDHGDVVNRRYRRSQLTWLTPQQSRRLLCDAGFEVEATYGDFDDNPLTESSTHQVWVARR
jgi:ubiquinone/menaquinone biosynthesis C-methylase UbiE